MSFPYLIELRLRGDSKDVTKKLIFDIYNKFGVHGAVKKRPVPHVSLFGPFNTRSIKEIISIMNQVGKEYSRLDYEITGFGYFEHKVKSFLIPRKKKNVIYLKIKPDSNLLHFRHALAKEIIHKTKSKNIDYDSESDFKFHATLAMKDVHQKFKDIWDYLENYDIRTNGVCYRMTLLRNGKIVCEYDFVQKRILSRREALSKSSWLQTRKILKAKI